VTTDPEGGFLQALEDAARNSRDIDGLVALLRALPEVHSVEVRNYLVKTEPPIRELAIQFRTARFIADITLHPDGSLTVHGLHES
jgi:hypothetical protein